jgi:tRNA(adenine34) deaminase
MQTGPVQIRAPDAAAVRTALDVLREHGSSGGDIPVGAVVIGPDGGVIGQGWNQRTDTADPTAHAEIVALRNAAHRLHSWRLTGCTLAITLEPCPMCAGAAAAARIDRVVFGAWNPDYGAAGSLFDLLRDPRLPHRCEVVGGVLGEECRAPIEAFFAQRRAVPPG